MAFAIPCLDGETIVLVPELELQDIHGLDQSATFLFLQTMKILQTLTEHLIQIVLIRAIWQIIY